MGPRRADCPLREQEQTDGIRMGKDGETEKMNLERMGSEKGDRENKARENGIRRGRRRR